MYEQSLWQSPFAFVDTGALRGALYSGPCKEAARRAEKEAEERRQKEQEERSWCKAKQIVVNMQGQTSRDVECTWISLCTLKIWN